MSDKPARKGIFMKITSQGALLVFFCLILYTPFGICQTKTEQAKNKLDSAYTEKKTDREQSSTEKKHKHKNSHNEDGSVSSCFGDMIGDIFVEMFKVSFHALLNIPLSFDEDSPLAAQPVYYNKYPYQDDFAGGIRTTEQYDPLRLQTQISVGRNYLDHLTTLNLDGTLHFYGWATRVGYKYIDEKKAPFGINYFSGKIERKSMAFQFMDMGFSAGFGLIDIDNTGYGGLELGYNLELFPIKAFSLTFNPNIMFYNNRLISNIVTSINYHYRSYYLGAGYTFFAIAGVRFDTIQIRAGKYF